MLMGDLLTGLCMQDPLLSPPSAWEDIFQRSCLQSCLQTSPLTNKKSYTKFQNTRKVSPPFSTLKSHIAAGKGEKKKKSQSIVDT